MATDRNRRTCCAIAGAREGRARCAAGNPGEPRTRSQPTRPHAVGDGAGGPNPLGSNPSVRYPVQSISMATETMRISHPNAPAGPSAEQDDVRRAAGGDAAAFERLYRGHAARIHSLCRRMAGPDEADDLTQEVFVRAWRKLDGFRGDAAFGTWLFRLGINVILAKRATAGTYRARFVTETDAPVPIAERGRSPVPVGSRLDLERALGKLPEGARRVFVLHDVEGYKHEEIAEMLSITAGTSKSQLHRARMTLREHLK